MQPVCVGNTSGCCQMCWRRPSQRLQAVSMWKRVLPRLEGARHGADPTAWRMRWVHDFWRGAKPFVPRAED
eukprot:1917913-Prorocentrum_lima.AAC.1